MGDYKTIGSPMTSPALARADAGQCHDVTDPGDRELRVS